MTRIYYKNGEVGLDQRRLETVLINFLSSFGLDLKLLRRNLSRYLNMTLYVPLPVKADLVLMPVKLRLPIAVKDGATGYVSYCAIKDIISAKGSKYEQARCLIVLEGGHHVPCYTSRSNLENRIKSCRITRELFCSQQGLKQEGWWSKDRSAFFRRFFSELAAEVADPYVEPLSKTPEAKQG